MSEKYWKTLLLKVFETEDLNINKIQETIQFIINDIEKKDKITADKLYDVLISLDGVGCDIDRAKEIVEGLI